MSDVYHRRYDGCWSMIWFDGEDKLRRWLRNYAPTRYLILDEHSWVVIKEKIYWIRGKKLIRYIGEVGHVSSNEVTRIIEFEPGSPPPPSFYRKAKPLPEKPQKTVTEEAMNSAELNYWRNFYWRPHPYHYYGSMMMKPSFEKAPLTPPPEPKYRRNV